MNNKPLKGSHLYNQRYFNKKINLMEKLSEMAIILACALMLAIGILGAVNGIINKYGLWN